MPIRLSLLLVTIMLSAVSPLVLGGTLLVVNKDGDSVHLLDADEGAVFAELPVGPNPHEIAVSPDGRTAVVGDYEGGVGRSLTLIDISAAKTRKIDLRRRAGPHGIAWLNNGNQLLITAEAINALLQIDVNAAKVSKIFPINQEVTHMLALSPNQRTAYVSNILSHSVAAVDLESDRALSHVTTDVGAEGIAAMHDGSAIWVANQEAQTVSVVDAESMSVIETITGLSYPVRVAIMPDDRYALVSNLGDDTLRVIDTASRTQVRSVDLGAGAAPIGVLPHPDGSRVFVSLSYHDQVAVVETEEWSVADRYRVGSSPDGLAYTDHEPRMEKVVKKKDTHDSCAELGENQC